MKSILKSFSFACFLIVLTPWILSAGEALDFVKSKVHYFDSLRKQLTKNTSPQNRKDIRTKARKAALDIIDEVQITRLSLGKHYKRIPPKQIKVLEGLFQQIISEKITHVHISTNPVKTKKNRIPIKILSSTIKQDDIFNQKAYTVKTQIKNKKTIYDIDIYLYKKFEQLYLYDVHVDEASILLDFKNQFAKIIRTKGIQHLLKKMKKQVAKFKK